MIVSLTQFRAQGFDQNGHLAPVPAGRIACQALTAAGPFTALDNDCAIIRIATDTAIRVDIVGGVTDTQDELIPANSVEYFSVNGGETLTIAAA